MLVAVQLERPTVPVAAADGFEESSEHLASRGTRQILLRERSC